jgi:putative chitinase
MKEFFARVREAFGPLSQNQVNGLNILLIATKALRVQHRAYVLATAWHETGPERSILHMTPRLEIWGPTEAQLRYEGREDLGNTEKGDGKRFMGRGYVQITGRANYRRASKLVGQDLVAVPSLAMRPEIASVIIVDGMVNGWFTGKKMADYGSFIDMRRVVNGTDKAALIGGYAEKFEDALEALAPAAPPVVILPVPKPTPPAVTPAPSPAPAPVPAGAVSMTDLARILRKIADEIEAA